jgi:Na+-translocating ferredoxin:NAD+ oxidoreductase subunit G
MAKRESTFINMVMALLVITLIASTSLGFIYELTKEPIEAARSARKNSAINSVVPDFDNNPVAEQYTVDVSGGTLVFYPAKMEGTLVGTAIETFTGRGFSGEIILMVGLLPDGTIHGIEVLEHRETPGLGDKIETGKSGFHLQFEGNNPAEGFRASIRQDGGDIDAITATTISSRAYCDAVMRAWNAYMMDDEISYDLPSREEAIARVLPEFTNNPILEDIRINYQGKEIDVFPGRRGRNYTGFAVESSCDSGFRGPIRLMVGFDNSGIITGVEVLEHNESPNYGALLENARSNFYKQFIGKNPAEEDIGIKQDGGMIDVVSGATVSSRAYSQAVRAAWEVFRLKDVR